MTTRKRATRHQAFGERIYELREQAQLTQNELAAKASMSRAGLSRILTGAREVRTQHVLQLALALRLTAAALVEGTDAEGVLGNWIPRVQYDRSERDRIRANDALVAARTELATLTASERVLSAMVHDLRVELAVTRLSRDKLKSALKNARRRR
jgi:transcriptional regulator with XRE-family HTH domain